MSALVETLLADAEHRTDLLAELTSDELVHVLEATADVLDTAQARLDAGYALRLAIYEAARERDPKVTQQRLAQAARVSEPAVIQTLKKARQDREKAAAAKQ